MARAVARSGNPSRPAAGVAPARATSLTLLAAVAVTASGAKSSSAVTAEGSAAGTTGAAVGRTSRHTCDAPDAAVHVAVSSVPLAALANSGWNDGGSTAPSAVGAGANRPCLVSVVARYSRLRARVTAT